MKLEAITTVYSYRFPEIRKIIDEVTTPFPHEVFLSATSPPGALDNFHEHIIEKILLFYGESVPNLMDFGFSYPTAGSEEGIREILTQLQTQGVKKIYVLNGEYEGYEAVAKTRGIETITVEFDTNPRSLERGYWFISNPSARDGNIIPNQYIREICDAGHKVFYDMAYLGSTKQHEFDLNHENIFSAVVSFSKPFGLFYDRIGVTFSKEPVNSLYANKWFKGILGLMIAEKIVDSLEPTELHQKYRSTQQQIVEGINTLHNLALQPSDALLLANISPDNVSKLGSDQLSLLEPFKRGKGYRICLTPYYRKMERGG